MDDNLSSRLTWFLLEFILEPKLVWRSLPYRFCFIFIPKSISGTCLGRIWGLHGSIVVKSWIPFGRRLGPEQTYLIKSPKQCFNQTGPWVHFLMLRDPFGFRLRSRVLHRSDRVVLQCSDRVLLQRSDRVVLQPTPIYCNILLPGLTGLARYIVISPLPGLAGLPRYIVIFSFPA